MNDSWLFFLLLALGALLGAGITWLVMREKLKAASHGMDAKQLELLTNRAVQNSSEQILQLASERFKLHVEQGRTEQAQRSEQLTRTLAPIATTLHKLEEQVSRTEKHRIEAGGMLNSQLKMLAQQTNQLSQEANTLASALRAPGSRGRWGEVQLRNIVEASGMLPHVDFLTQASSSNVSGQQQRPDLVVHLSGGRSLVVDAKVPMDAYLEALATNDQSQRQALLKAHASAMSGHVKTLHSKAYWNALPDTPEFVVMFVPADGLLAASLETDPLLLENAFKQNVVIASPATLMALLKTVSHTWRSDALNQDARAALAACQELYSRMETFAGHMHQVGKSINQSVQAFNKAAGSYTSRLLPTLRNLEEMQLTTATATEPQPVTAISRSDFATETSPEPQSGRA